VTWVLRRARSDGENRPRYTLPQESLSAQLVEGAWWQVEVRRESSLRPLCVEFGYRVVSGPPWGEGTTETTPAAAKSAEVPMHLDFVEWADRLPGDEGRRDEGEYEAACRVLRGRRPKDAVEPPKHDSVAIVLTLTGWTTQDHGAAMLAVEVCRELGGDGVAAHVVVVQNDPTAHEAMRAWRSPTKWARRVYAANDGFAAACNAGAAAARKGTSWLLFTQSDCSYTSSAVREAIANARKVRAVVGASGGMLQDGGAAILEVGRNSGVDPSGNGGASRVVDFVAGYWLLIPAALLEAVGGWWEGVFLYYEDPDLCLRAALHGWRSRAMPSLGVRHGRSATIRPRFGDHDRRRIQTWSRKAFLRRWRQTGAERRIRLDNGGDVQ